MKALQKTNPEYYKNLIDIKQHEIDFNLKSATKSYSTTGILTIPVIVHVIWNTSSENISDAQIESQIDVLNEDFRRNNPDASNTPTEFTSVAADIEIEFILSNIIRKNTTKSSFSISDVNWNGIFDLSEEQAAGIKFDPDGSEAISTDKYLNIWVCNLEDGLLGYAQFPGGDSSIDGVVVTYNSFGRIGTLNPPFDEGRTATHEIGHWLNLYHIWGDDGTSCSGTDEVDDTPNQAGPNYDCPTHPHLSCSSNDMFMNYMDYTDDGCMNTFTQGQKTRMHALFSSGGARESFADCNDIEIKNQTISTDKNIDGCNDITIENITIQNNANVEINNGNEITIEKNFEVEVGSTFKIE
ncbi:MAG: zinc metalloprotease [Candidatus Methanofastidiosa archaeon]|nr:zinc metalloprotease [Candidatus Methanofastidiosa archaeon]